MKAVELKDWPKHWAQRRIIRRPEQADQIALLRWAELVQVGHKTLADWLTHIPNGGARTPVEGGILKAMGVKPGMPDLLLPIQTTRYSAGWWELKAGEGKPSESQVERQAMLRAGGAYVAVYWHWQECARDILRYLQHGPFTVIERGKL